MSLFKIISNAFDQSLKLGSLNVGLFFFIRVHISSESKNSALTSSLYCDVIDLFDRLIIWLDSKDEGDCSKDEGGCSEDVGDCSKDEGGCSKDEGGCSKDEGDCSKDVGVCFKDEGGCSKDVGVCFKDKGDCSEDVGVCFKDEGDDSEDVGNCSKDEDYNSENIELVFKDKFSSSKLFKLLTLSKGSALFSYASISDIIEDISSFVKLDFFLVFLDDLECERLCVDISFIKFSPSV